MKNVITTLQAVLMAAIVLGCQSTPPAPPASQPAKPAEPRQEAAPPPPTAPPPAAPMKAPESTAPDAKPEAMTIMEMQKRLGELGYNPGPADGLSGKKTGDALKKFQQEHHLPPTGVLDSETIRRLRSAKR